MNLPIYGGGTLRPRRGVTHTLNERGGACAVGTEGWERAAKGQAFLRIGPSAFSDPYDADSLLLASECREEAAACRAERNAYLHGLEERLLRGGGVDGE